MIADIGGSLGLCIGASLLCICEAIEFIVDAILVLKRKIVVQTRVTKEKE